VAVAFESRLPLLDLALVLGLTGLGEAVGCLSLEGELGDDMRKFANVFVDCGWSPFSSSSSEVTATFRLRRFAGGAISHQRDRSIGFDGGPGRI
jgi:hypothetical protein